jgi:hypothetical protein
LKTSNTHWLVFRIGWHARYVYVYLSSYLTLPLQLQGPYIGLRSPAAGWRFLQPRKRAPHRLVFFNVHCGIWEQWEVSEGNVIKAVPKPSCGISLRWYLQLSCSAVPCEALVNYKIIWHSPWLIFKEQIHVMMLVNHPPPCHHFLLP